LKVVTIIPARGGSKGIPRKNIIDINGKPLISYVIRASLGSNVDETWVSSEDDEILLVSSEYGARTLRRPDELSNDRASSESVLLHFAKQVQFDILVFLQATSPMTTSNDINKGIVMMSEFDSIITVTELSQFVWYDNKPSYDIDNRQRRQDCEQSFIETGAMFITTRERLLGTKNRISGDVGLLVVPKIRSFDIDTFDDLKVVRKLMS
jgi:CMP-N,N'-diacetyllegionaminic acid synthase